MTDQEVMIVYHAAVGREIELLEGELSGFAAHIATKSDCSRTMGAVKRLMLLREAQLMGLVL